MQLFVKYSFVHMHKLLGPSSVRAEEYDLIFSAAKLGSRFNIEAWAIVQRDY